jgi:hypothetical protein
VHFFAFHPASLRTNLTSPLTRSDEEHEQAMTEVQRMAAVLAGGEDEKLFAAPQVGAGLKDVEGS